MISETYIIDETFVIEMFYGNGKCSGFIRITICLKVRWLNKMKALKMNDIHIVMKKKSMLKCYFF